MKVRSKGRKEQILMVIEETLAPRYMPPYCNWGAHDVDHVRRMCRIAEKICDEAQLFLVKLAVWFHNIDRSNFWGPDPDEESIIRGLLARHEISTVEIELLVDAVQNHRKRNPPNPSWLLMILQDLDKLDFGPVGVLRIAAAAFTRNPFGLPLLQPGDFDTDRMGTKDKDLKTVVADIVWCLAWEDMLHTDEAKEYAEKEGIFTSVRAFLKLLEEQLKELGFL